MMIPIYLIVLHIMIVLAPTLWCGPISERAQSTDNGEQLPGTLGVLAAVAATFCCCFSSTARISLENGETKTMSQLKIGDKVKGVSPDGTIIYTEVKSFLDKMPTTITKYKSIETYCNNTLTVSGQHLIYTKRKGTNTFKPVYSEDVSDQDEVLVYDYDRVAPATVTNISNIYIQGAYSPLTTEGKILVDGVLASCYASFPDHDMAHLTMAPMRWFPEVMHWIFGEDTEVPVYVKITEYFGRSISPNMIL